MPAIRTQLVDHSNLRPSITPTCSGYRLESASDIVLLLEACERFSHHFPLVPHRINGEVYRPLIDHGNVFVFEQRPSFKRWTDCRSWTDNQQVKKCWLVYRESVPRPRINTYGRGVNKHPTNKKRYTRPYVQPIRGGLQKRTATVTVTSPGSSQPPRTLSIIAFVDPQREPHLIPLAQHPDMAGIAVVDIPLSKYQFKQEELLAQSSAPRQSGRRPSPRSRALPRTPSLSPAASSLYNTSISPVTPFSSLPLCDHLASPWTPACNTRIATLSYHTPIPPLTPYCAPASAAVLPPRPTLPSIHEMFGDLLSLHERGSYSSWGRY